MSSPFEVLVDAINKKQNIYISGVGGCGKSYLLKQLHKHFLEKDKKSSAKAKAGFVLTSTTGISAFNLGGVTLHSFTKIILSKDIKDVPAWINQQVNRISRKAQLRARYFNLKVLFIDEVSMLGSQYLDALNYIFKCVRNNDEEFGGVQLVLAGDMMQLPPVKDDFPFESYTWPLLKLKYFRLTKAWRFDHQRWVDLLHRARLGQLNDEDKELLSSRIQSPQLVNGVAPTQLASTNYVVESINRQRLSDLGSDSVIFVCSDFKVIRDEDDNVVSKEHSTIPINASKDLIVDQLLEIKVGSQVMLLANLSVTDGFVNGTRGIVLKIGKLPDGTPQILVQFENGQMIIETYDFRCEHDETHYVRKAIPLKLAFATTIHKSQSLTLSSVELEIGSDVFTEGQSYVALSRCKSLEGLYIRQIDFKKIRPHSKAAKFEQMFLKQCIDL